MSESVAINLSPSFKTRSGLLPEATSSRLLLDVTLVVPCLHSSLLWFNPHHLSVSSERVGITFFLGYPCAYNLHDADAVKNQQGSEVEVHVDGLLGCYKAVHQGSRH